MNEMCEAADSWLVTRRDDHDVAGGSSVRQARNGRSAMLNSKVAAPTEETTMQSAVVKRSIVIAGHKTSVSLEDDFWNALKEIKRSNNMTLSSLVADIDVRRLHANLSSAIRIFVLQHYRSQISPGSRPQIPQMSSGSIEDGTEMPQLVHVGRPSRHVNGRLSEQFKR
jgi:predicted DNA-binding ribbon-helix-helix protein